MFKQFFILLSVVLVLNAASAFRLPRATSDESDSSEELKGTLIGTLSPIFDVLAKDDVDVITQAHIDTFKTEALKTLPAEQVNHVVTILNKLTAANPEDERLRGFIELFAYAMEKVFTDFDKAIGEFNVKFDAKKQLPENTSDNPSPAIATEV